MPTSVTLRKNASHNSFFKRDYKEHGQRKEQDSFRRTEETTVSSPSLSSWSSPSSRSRDDTRSGSSSSTDSGVSSHSWSSSSTSSRGEDKSSDSATSRFSSGRPAASWTSTPDLGKLNDDTKAAVTVNLTLPRRRPVQPVDTGQEKSTSESAVSDSFTLRRRSTEITPPPAKVTESEKSTTSNTTTTSSSTSRQRARKSTTPSTNSSSSDNAKETGRLRRVRIQSLKEVHSIEEPSNPEVKKSKDKKSANSGTTNSISSSLSSRRSYGAPILPGASSSSSGTSEEEESDDDLSSLAGTETTETTLVDRNESELQEQIDSLKQELEMMRARCERVEREKSDILLRRIAALDTTPSKTAASEVLKLQQKVNELQSQAEDLRDDKKSLGLRVRELEEELDIRPDKVATQKTVDELRSKLLAAETLCEELMDENEDMKKELRDLEEEIEEMQDNFREEQADEYTSLKKELEQTNKNCRILSFKLRKAERKAEQLEAEKIETEKKYKEMAGGQTGLEKVEKMKKLEQELAVANEVSKRLQKELEDTNAKLKAKEEASTKEAAKKKAPMLGSIGKVSSGEKVSRESLTRGGSQEDPQQLLRDLQDSLEREADLREQLRFAEEERWTRHKLIVKEKNLNWRNAPVPSIPSLQPDVVPSRSYPMDAPHLISRRQFQYNTVLPQSGAHEPTVQTISSGTQTNFVEIPATSRSRPMVIQQSKSLETEFISIGIQTFIMESATCDSCSQTQTTVMEDKTTEFDMDISQVANKEQCTESTQTNEPAVYSSGTQTNTTDTEERSTEFESDFLLLTNAYSSDATQTDVKTFNSFETQTEELFKETQITQTEFNKELESSVSTQTVPTLFSMDSKDIQTDLPKEFETSASTQTLVLTSEIATETEMINKSSNMVSRLIQTEMPQEFETSACTQTFIQTDNVTTETEAAGNSSIPTQTEELIQNKNVENSIQDSSTGQESVDIPGNVFSHLLNIPTLSNIMEESSLSVDGFSDQKETVSVQTDHSSFPQESMSSMRQFQFSISTIFPPGSLLSRSSPMGTLLKPLGRRHSPSPARLTPEPSMEKDEGISDEEDPAELRILLELNEQEASVLRRKVEELEGEGENLKKKVKELQDKLLEKTTRKNTVASLSAPDLSKGNSLHEQKIKIIEDEVSELRKKLIEKDRDCERLHAELAIAQKRVSKGSLQKSKSLDSGNEQQALDLKKQLAAVEQEATLLRNKNQTLESDNEKLATENRKLLLEKAKKSPLEIELDPATKQKITKLETQLTDANKKKIKLLEIVMLKISLDSGNEQQALDLKKQLAAVEQEATLLRNKNQTLESDNEKLATENRKLLLEKTKKSPLEIELDPATKQKITKLETQLTDANKKVKDLEGKLSEMEVTQKAGIKDAAELTKLKKEMKTKTDELDKLKTQSKKALKRLKDEAVANATKFYKQRTPKKPTDLSTKLQLKKMVEDLESEIGEIMVVLSKAEIEKPKEISTEDKAEKDKLKKELEESKNKIDELEKSLKDEKDKADKEKKKAVKDKKTAEDGKKKAEEEFSKLEEEKKSWNLEKKKLEDGKKKAEDERKKAKEEAEKLTEDKKKLEEEVTKLNADKAAASVKQDEVAVFVQRIESLKTELEIEQQQGVSLRQKLENATKVELEKSKLQKEVSEKTKKITESEKKIKEVEDKLKKTERFLTANKNKVTKLEKEEANVKEEQDKVTTAYSKAGISESKEIKSLKEQLESSKTQTQELTTKLEKAEKSQKTAEDKCKKTEAEMKKTKTELETKVSELEVNLQAEKKKCERMKISQDKELKNREQELSSLRTKLRSLEGSGANGKKIAEVKEEYQGKIKKLEEQLKSEKQEYEDLTAKQLLSTENEMESSENELRTVRETFNTKQDAWIKEKLDLQEKVKELEEKMSRSNGSDSWMLEKTRLKSALQDKSIEMEQLKKESEMNAHQTEHLRKEKLEDFDKVVKVQRNMSADTSAVEKELRQTKNKLYEEEKSHKTEMAQLKLRYDSRVAVISEEIQGLQGQVSRFKRERDTFRHMLEGAQRTIAELKSSSSGRDSRSSGSNLDDAEETQSKIQSLEQQISCMEDELSEARLEASKLKTELISERSAWEVKRSEMQSHMNELEEDRIVQSGRTKIPGMRTRMELAWHKEREEQHRLLQETSTLARDLRQTLFEVERERDKERLEAKRKHDQLKKSTEEEQDENRKKVTELQCDLLELRDAHAKLRTTNEKLRREKERYEKEREELKQMASGKKRAEQDEERRVNILLEQVDELMRLAPDLFAQKGKPDSSSTSSLAAGGPVAPKRLKGPKSRESSRESSPQLQRKEFQKETSVDRKLQLQSTVQRLSEVTEELRKLQRLSEEERERERAKKMFGMRRAASTESDDPNPSIRPKPLGAPKTVGSMQKKGSLYRKSLSLEQTSGQQDQYNIWKGDSDNEGSVTSLQSYDAGSESQLDSRYYTLPKRESSLDSRLSGGSTQSEVGQDKKKKKGILGKLKKLTKSRSIDDGGTEIASGMSQVIIVRSKICHA
ncbi:hypothetical protein C0J52_15173 [Blattella germanica]|nr:hypothetical protein C0J52_15173 [Blattella germanica]